LATGFAFSLLTINNGLKVVQKRRPFYEDYLREIKHSFISLFIFTVIATILYKTKLLEYTTLYYNIEEHGWLYYFMVIPLMFIIYDFYFYLIHVIIHHKNLFDLIHVVHHKSKYLSPLSSLSMHPIEAILNHLALVMLFFILPIHTSHVYIWVSITIAYTTYLHLGVEIYSERFLNTRIGKLVYTATEHAKHHSFFKGNYGFYTLIWDKIFKTYRK
jgi:sterol desaturase/sphingolipid hydroxylase (fatty acid hydroxylase superfamily)